MNVDRIIEFLNHLKVDFKDQSLVVLKGHLLLELALRDYIGARVKHPKRLIGPQINFASLIVFASTLEDSEKDNWLWPALKKANTLRNQLSHNLMPKKIDELINDFIGFVRDNDGDLGIEVNDIEVDYGPLPIALFQVFDALLHSYPMGERIQVNSGGINVLAKALDMVGEENA